MPNARRKNTEACAALDDLIEVSTAAFVNMHQAAAFHPTDGAVRQTFVETLDDLQRYLDLRDALDRDRRRRR